MVEAHMMMLSGTKLATLRQVQLVDIHGTRFYDVAYTLDDMPEQIQTARIGVEDVYANPQPGDAIGVRYLMNVVVSIAAREV
jgi:hypothetical protein